MIYTVNGKVKNITMSNLILDGDGNDSPNRKAFYGEYIGDTWIITGCTFKNFYHWYVIDNTHSSHDVPI